jgi:predicted transcriptional regulator
MVELDGRTATGIEVPAEVVESLDRLSYSRQRAHVLAVGHAKKAETRQRWMADTVRELRG